MAPPNRSRSDGSRSTGTGTGTGSRSSARGSRTSSAPASGRRTARSSGPPVGVGIAIGAVVVVVVIGFVLFGGGEPSSAASGTNAPAAPKSESTPPTASAPARPASAGLAPSTEGRAGKTPGTPAPPIAEATFQRTEELYAKATAAWDAGQRARSAGKTDEFDTHVQESRGHLEALFDVLRPYTTWYEEADLEGWALPADYVTLQRYLNRYDPLRVKLKKARPKK